jgi:sarcosine oxidase, subunit beta
VAGVARPIPSEADLVVVGGGIVGLALALYAARDGRSTVVIERERIGGVATRRSGALIRVHYPRPAEALLAWRGLELFERFAEEIGGDAGFRPIGFVYIPDAAERASDAFAARMAMLTGIGAPTRTVDRHELAEIVPAFAVEDVEVAAYEPRSGYADPIRTGAAVAAAAVRAGALLASGVTVRRLTVRSGAIAGVDTDAGPVAASRVALCAGAWSVALGQTINLDMRVRPAAALPARYRFRLAGLAVPATIDVANDVYFRPAGADGLLGGRRDWAGRELAGPDDPPPPIDAARAADTIARIARRAPGAHGARWAGGLGGPIDLTPDGAPLLGPAGPDGLWLSCGWSGTGFKTALAAGRALAAWMRVGEPPEPELRAFDPSRFSVAGARP